MSYTDSSILATFDRNRIIQAGWKQGALCAPFASDGRNFPQEFSHWLLCSHTCSVAAHELKQFPLVEFVGGHISSSLDLRNQRGETVRTFQMQHISPDGELSQTISFSIYDRFWIPRELLMSNHPLPATELPQQAGLHGSASEKLKSWLSRSYSRLVLSDEVNLVLSRSRISESLSKISNEFSDELYGVFLSLRPTLPNQNNSFDNPSEWCDVIPPCIISFTFVCHDLTSGDKIREAVKDKFAFPAPSKENVIVGKKFTRYECANHLNISIVDPTDPKIKLISQWSVQDMLETVRYTDMDHLSLGDAAVDPVSN